MWLFAVGILIATVSKVDKASAVHVHVKLPSASFYMYHTDLAEFVFACEK